MTASASICSGSSCDKARAPTGPALANTSASASLRAESMAAVSGSGVLSSVIRPPLLAGAAPHQDRSELPLLTQSQGAATCQFEAGEQCAGQRGTPRQRTAECLRQEVIEAGPVRQAAQQRREALQRVLDAP